MFRNSSNVGIFGGTFMDQHHHTHTVTKESAMDRLLKASSPAAFHNSGERFDPPKCHPNTRTAVLKKLMDWLIGKAGWDMFVLWLYGPAGAGKSAIAQTFAQNAAAMNSLLASFFFSRSDPKRNNAKALAATLAYQVASNFGDCVPIIESAIEKDPLLLERTFETQFNELIIKPLVHLASTELFISTSIPYLVIIDGLDECLEPASQRSILTTISNALQKHRTLPLIFVVASRPEYHLTTVFSSPSLSNMTFRLALDDTVDPCADIKLYLVDCFHDIRETHILRDRIPKSWPTEENVERLAKKSSGQFIYAATVIRYVSSFRHNPMNRLQVIHGILPVNNDKPYAQLDALYINILSGVENVEAVLQVLGVHLVTSDRGGLAITKLETFMLLSAGDIQLLLIDLVSVLDASDEKQPIRFLHASFNDFLCDQTRSLEFYIDPTRMHAEAAHFCLWHINAFWKAGSVIDGQSEYPLSDRRAFIYHLQHGAINTQGLRQEILDGHYLECLPYMQKYRKMQTDFTTSDGTDIEYFLNFLHFSNFTDNKNLYLHQRSVWDRMLLKALRTLHGSRELAFWTALYAAPKFWGFSHLDFETIKALSSPGEAPYLSYTPFILIHALGQGIEDVVDPTGPRAVIDKEYRELLVDFLADPSRAGPYTLDESTYTMAAEFLLAFAVRPWDKEKKRFCPYPDVILRFVWNIFPAFLSQAGHSDELIRVLGCEKLTFSLPSLYPYDNEAHTMLRAVVNYLGKYTGCVPTGFHIAVDEWKPGVNGRDGNNSNSVYYLDSVA